jgi:hypothetical protein
MGPELLSVYLSDRLCLRGAYESTTARGSGSPQVATGYTLVLGKAGVPVQ